MGGQFIMPTAYSDRQARIYASIAFQPTGLTHRLAASALTSSFTPSQCLRSAGLQPAHNAHAKSPLRACTSGSPQTTSASSTTSGSTPRVATTTTQTYTDERGNTWSFGMDVMNAHSSNTPIVLMHNVVAVGLSRWYWDPLFAHAASCAEDDVWHRPLIRFDYVYTGDATPKPDVAPSPMPSLDEFADQVAHICRTTSKPPIVLAVGGVEPAALRFAGLYPTLLSALMLHNGVSSRYVTTNVRDSLRTRLLYKALSGRLGLWFYRYFSTEDFIRGFLLKNVWTDALDERFDRKVALSVQSAQADDRLRFPFLAFLVGCFFQDLSEDLAKIAVPTLFVAAGKLASGKLPKQTASTALRVPVPIAADEGSMTEARTERVEDRKRLIADCEGFIAEGVSLDIYYSNPTVMTPYVKRFLNRVGL